LIAETFWPGVSKHRQQNHGPLVLSASHTSTVAEQLSAMLAVLYPLPRTRQIINQFIINQLNSISFLILPASSSPSLPVVSPSDFFTMRMKLFCVSTDSF